MVGCHRDGDGGLYRHGGWENRWAEAIYAGGVREAESREQSGARETGNGGGGAGGSVGELKRGGRS